MHRIPPREPDCPDSSSYVHHERGAGSVSTSNQRHLKQQSLEWLNEYGDVLYAYAIRRVATKELAEELVQETFLGAIRSQNNYCGAASPKTWLIGILRHKLVDHYRQKTRVPSLACLNESHRQRSVDIEPEKSPEPIAKAWADPIASLSEAEFQEVLRECISELPDLVRQAFEYRFFDEMELAEVCELQSISRNNLAARMYRARAFLRECLDRRWF